MTGIALGDLNIPKISIGDTPIVKVSMGDTLVWPSAPVVVTSATVVATEAATSLSISFPSTARVGDVVVFLDRATGSGVTQRVPTGFTYITGANVAGGGASFGSSYKIVTQADLDTMTPITGINNGAVYQKMTLLVRDASGAKITQVNSYQPQAYIFDTDPPQLSFTDGSLIYSTPTHIQIAFYGTTNAGITTRTWTATNPPTAEVLGISSRIYCKYRHNIGAGDYNLVIDMPDAGIGNTLAGYILRFT